MDALEAILTRRSTRRFSEEAVDKALIEKVMAVRAWLKLRPTALLAVDEVKALFSLLATIRSGCLEKSSVFAV